MISEMPNIDGLRPAVLAVLAAKREPVRLLDLLAMVADHVGLDEDMREETLASGGNRLRLRVSYACSSLTIADLLERPQRGFYRITDNGRAVAERHLEVYRERDLEEWPQWRSYQEELAERREHKASESEGAGGSGAGGSSPAPAAQSSDEDGQSLLERVRGGIDELNNAVETRLRARLQQASPQFFEKAVVELLKTMGYSGTNGRGRTVGGSGDGGIDGVIDQDALGLQKIYIQAKRYADGNAVQRPAIQQFFGALSGKGAGRGVFITTSTFTRGAREEAQRYGGQMVLIDGIRLTALMRHYGVAVQPLQDLEIYQIDEDFFEEDEELG